MSRLLLMVVAVVVAVSAVSAAAGSAGSVQGRWVIRDLGVLPGIDSAAAAVNERGQVVVNAGRYGPYLRGGVFQGGRVFVWEKGRKTELGNLGGGGAAGSAINDRGQIVGVGTTTTPSGWGPGDRVWHAFLWDKGQMRDLGSRPGRPFSEAVAINERGQVIGNSYTRGCASPPSCDEPRAFLLDSGRARDLPVPAGRAWCRAHDINEKGQVVGLCGDTVVLWESGRVSVVRTPSGQPAFEVWINDDGQILMSVNRAPVGGFRPYAVLWQKGRATVLGEGFARAINNRGQVVFGAKLWDRGRITDLPMTPLAISDSGVVIGLLSIEYKDPGAYQYSSCSHAAVWENGTLTDLGVLRPAGRCDTKPHETSWPTAISTTGVVVGFSDLGSGKEAHTLTRRAVLWTKTRS